MAAYFLDSSALAKRYFEEPGTPRVLEIMQSGDRLVVSRLAVVEVASAGARRARAGGIAPELFDELILALEDDFRRLFEVVELSTAAMTRAVDLTRSHALRAADAIQLASALIARGERSQEYDFALVSSDGELNAAAQCENLAVIDPA
jgi:predicted nucleic acid-binding protein